MFTCHAAQNLLWDDLNEEKPWQIKKTVSKHLFEILPYLIPERQ
jgi:hypothetical protein